MLTAHCEPPSIGGREGTGVKLYPKSSRCTGVSVAAAAPLSQMSSHTAEGRSKGCPATVGGSLG